VGVGLRAGVTAPLVALGVSAFKAGEALDRSMANVQSLGVAQARVGEIKKEIQDLAIETGISTDILAAGSYQVVSAYGDSAESSKMLGDNARLAAAGLATVTDSINLTSAVMKGYNNVSDEANQKISDLAMQTVNYGQTTLPELANSMGKVVPLAAELNVSEEELFATMATLTGVTGPAAEVTTQLRGAMQSFMAPSAAMNSLLSDLGYESGKAMIEQLGFHGALLEVVDAAEESGKPLQSFMGSIEGQTAALALADSLADVYPAKLAEMANAVGATEAAFLAQTEGINATGAAMDLMKVQLQVTMQKLATGLVPAFAAVLEVVRPFVEKIGALATRFAELEPAQQKNIVKLLAVAAAIGPATTIVGGFVRGLGFLVPALATATGVQTAFAAASWAALWPILLVGAAIAAVVLAVKKWDKVREFFGTTGQVHPRQLARMERKQALVPPVVAGVEAFIPTAKNPGLIVAQSIDDYLPHSDAKKGPLSKLTESGSSIVETLKIGADKKRLDLSGPLGLNRGDGTPSGGSTVINIDHLTVQSEDAEDIFNFVRLIKVAGGVA